MLDDVDEQIERFGSQRDGCPSRRETVEGHLMRLGKLEIEKLQEVRKAGERSFLVRI